MDAGVASGLLQLAATGSSTDVPFLDLWIRREQKAVRPKALRRRGAVCGVAAPPRCAEASPSSRLLASDPAARAALTVTRGQMAAFLVRAFGIS